MENLLVCVRIVLNDGSFPGNNRKKGVQTVQDPKEIRKKQYFSMDPKHLVSGLVEKCVTHASGAKLAIEQKEFVQANEHLKNAQNILIQLQATIPKEGDEASRQGRQVLELLIRELFFCNINKDAARLEEAINILNRLASVTRCDQ